MKKILLVAIGMATHVGASAQMTPAQWNELQCVQLNEEEKRLRAQFEAQLADIQRKKESLAEDELQVQVKAMNEEIAKLRHEEAKAIADISLQYAERIAALQARLQVIVTRRKNSCAK